MTPKGAKMARGFTAADVPDMTGKTAFVTGANTGIGFEAAAVLVAKGARVLLGCRNRAKAEAAKERILELHAGANVDIIDLDQGDLASIKSAAERVGQEARLDLLINNAGIMIPPFSKTVDGFESQFGVNHIGVFALTGRLLEKLEETPGARVINTSSNMHKMGTVDFSSLNAEKGYNKTAQYSLSKLANLLHMYELDRRLKAAGRTTIAVAAHPGGSDTDLVRHMGVVTRKVFMPVGRLFLNSAAAGAWPTLMAATVHGLGGGEYFGPKGPFELAGKAVQVKSNSRSRDEALARRFWDVSVEMSGVDPGI